MKARHIIALAAVVGSFASSGASAWDQDPFAIYIQRKDTVTFGAGDARNVNAATHIIDPWPRYVGNRNIPVSGDRLARAIARYNQGSYRQPAAPVIPFYSTTIGLTGGAGGGGVAAAAAVVVEGPLAAADIRWYPRRWAGLPTSLQTEGRCGQNPIRAFLLRKPRIV